MDKAREYTMQILRPLTVVFIGLTGSLIGTLVAFLIFPKGQWCEAFNFGPAFTAWGLSFLGYVVGMLLALMWPNFRRKSGAGRHWSGVESIILLVGLCVGLVAAFYMPLIPLRLGLGGECW
jgi:hypothetical protein